MMKIENELTIINVDKDELIKKLESLGATKIADELLQIRYVYDFSPINPNKWIRLRTNGIKSTLTIKELSSESKMNAKEWEIEVSNFEETNNMLNQLGYFHRQRQENKRIVFVLYEVEISIDSWPLIPPYAEFEGKNEKSIMQVITKLGLDLKNLTSLDVVSIYKEIYGIDIYSIKNLQF